VEDVGRQSIEPLPRQRSREDGVGAGGVEGGGEAFDAPADCRQLGSPGGHEIVDAGVALHRSGLAGGDLAGSVGVGVAGLGQVGADLFGALGEQVADLGRDAGDAPMAQVPRRPVVRLDPVAEGDGSGGGVEPADHRGGLDGVAERGGVEALEPADVVEHLGHVGHQHVIVR
jgi:hypothetical protein